MNKKLHSHLLTMLIKLHQKRSNCDILLNGSFQWFKEGKHKLEEKRRESFFLNKLLLPSNPRITFGSSKTYQASFSVCQHVPQVVLLKHHYMIPASTFVDHFLHSRHYRLDIDEWGRLHFVTLFFKAMVWCLACHKELVATASTISFNLYEIFG